MARKEARIQTGALTAVGWSALLCFLDLEGTFEFDASGEDETTGIQAEMALQETVCPLCD